MAENVKMLWGPAAGHAFGPKWNGDISQFSLASASHKVAIIFASPKTGNIDRIAFRIRAFSGVSVGRVSIVSIDGTTGDPTVTNYGGSSPGSFTPVANTNFSVALGTIATVTRGDILAVVIDLSSFTSGAVTIVSGAQAYTIGADCDSLPYITSTTGGVWTRDENMPAIGIHFDDDDWISANLGDYDAIAVTYASGVEVGFKFQIPFPTSVTGAQFILKSGIGSYTITVKLYDAADNVLESVSIDSDTLASLFGILDVDQLLAIWFTNSIAIIADTNYRITIQHNGASPINMLRHSNLPDANMRAGYPWSDGSRWSWTTRNGGAWTDDTLKMSMCGLFLDGIG